jgi:hypothetical protein
MTQGLTLKVSRSSYFNTRFTEGHFCSEEILNCFSDVFLNCLNCRVPSGLNLTICLCLCSHTDIIIKKSKNLFNVYSYTYLLKRWCHANLFHLKCRACCMHHIENFMYTVISVFKLNRDVEKICKILIWGFFV